MAPARQPPQPFSKDEKVLCFHGEMLYEAKILDIQPAESGEGFQYRIHYKGWKNTWDDWVSIDRIRKFTEENKELASQLHAQMKDLRQKSSAKPPKKGNLRVNGTDSARGSEERTAGVAATGRGPRRARDFDLEQMSSPAWDSFARVYDWVLSQQAAQYSGAQPNYASPPQRGFMSRLDYARQLAHYRHNNPVGRAEDADEHEYRQDVEASQGEYVEIKTDFTSDFDYGNYETPAPASDDYLYGDADVINHRPNQHDQQRKRRQPEPDYDEEDAAFEQHHKRRRMYSDEDEDGNVDSDLPRYYFREEYDEYDEEEAEMNQNRLKYEEEDDEVNEEEMGVNRFDFEEDEGLRDYDDTLSERQYRNNLFRQRLESGEEDDTFLPNRRRKYMYSEDDFDGYDETSVRPRKKVRWASPVYEETEDEFYQADNEDEGDEDQTVGRASDSDGDVEPADIVDLISISSDETVGSDDDDDRTSITSDSSIEFLGERPANANIENQHDLRSFQDGESEDAKDVVEELLQRPCGTSKRKRENSVEILLEFRHNVRRRLQTTAFHSSNATLALYTLISFIMAFASRKSRPAEPLRRRPQHDQVVAWKEPRLLRADNLTLSPAPRARPYVTKDGKPNYDNRYDTSVTTLKREQPARAKSSSARSSETSEEELPTVSLHKRNACPSGKLPHEDGFHARPSIKLPIPDHIKAMLVDDWENITKNNQLVPLPHPHPVDDILSDYLNYERPNREDGSANMDILEEVVAGLREYFEKSLSRILLYRFERPQYHEIRKVWEKAGEEDKHKSVCDTYGPEHLCRLMVSLPELVAQTNMDQQSVARLREELSKLTVWLGKNAKNYFVSEYETPSQEYIDKARSF
ncbi:hypothetical protein CTAM01_08401 [Colletotrichum tamarilloi]|uniref:Chromatin modification-related protein EAF3 n=1 Tax=Colletotrichum tamarilloi TaxID=1209934 RepID=A0ABQ9R6R3_9PEZI|nr:uncharacterized protein CTAM01_08401 [Colletotrichum tamarilloi]KAK1496214.1 hypothetical protein CTAM01_08401 [Colletotrichum tamarilloi]